MRGRPSFLAAALFLPLSGCGSGGGGADAVGVTLSVDVPDEADTSGQVSLAGGGDGIPPLLGDTVIGMAPMTAEIGVRAYVGFDFTRIPVGSTVESAILEIRLIGMPVGDPASLGTMYAVPVDFDFVETYPSTLPAEAFPFSTPAGEPPTTFTADVKTLVEDAISGISDGKKIGVRYATDSNGNDADDITGIQVAILHLVIRTP